METITAPLSVSSRSNPHFNFGDMVVAKTGLAVAPEKIDCYVRDRIAFKTERMGRKFCLNQQSQEDLQQDFYLALIQSLANYDPARSRWKTYFSGVLDRRYKHQVRHFITMEENESMKPIPLTELEDEGEYLCGPDNQVQSGYSQIDLQMDFEAVKAKMPERLQQVLGLMAEKTGSEIAQIMGVSPASITRFRKEIKAHFAAAGFREFVRAVK